MSNAANYEIDNPQIKSIMKEIATRIGGAVPDPWGFMLMLFEMQAGGANFYICNADRDDVIRMMLEWIEKQTGTRPVIELNPTDKTTSKLRGQWEKVVAILLHKLGSVTITADDLNSIAQYDEMPTIKADDRSDGLHLSLVTRAEATALANDGKGDLK